MDSNALVTILLIVICVQVVLIALLATRPPQVKVVEVEIEKKLQPPPKQVPTGPVDVELEMNKLIRKIERRHGLFDNFRTVWRIADQRKVCWWHDDETGRFMFQFEDILEYEQVQAEAEQFELEQQLRLAELDVPDMLPEEAPANYKEPIMEITFDA